jgi:uncharacterized membrane protein YuzA (DUF378 family)
MDIFDANPNTMVYVKWFNMVIMTLVLIGGLNWLSIGVLGIDAVRLGLAPRHAKWIYTLIGLAALSLVFRRDIYLPFLGETIVPGGALAERTPQNANDQVTITTVPGAKVLYWASEPNPTQGKDVPNWDEAYSEFENSGVAIADGAGKAILRFRGPPQTYQVPIMGKLEPHVHFRICNKHGVMGSVQTKNVKTGGIEEFKNLI